MQIHQVARVRGELDPVLEDNSVETRASRRPHGNLGHSPWASNSIPARAGEAPRPPPVLSRHYGLLGQCYLSTVNGQCANPLGELTSQEDCCGSVGTFWGVTSCAPCPPRPGEYWFQDGGLEGILSPSLTTQGSQGQAIFPDVPQGASRTAWPVQLSAQPLGLCST